MTDLQQVDDDPRLAALMRWRGELIDSRTVSGSSFKEAHVRLVLRSGVTEIDEIRAMLPGAVAAHAEEMAQVLQGAEAPVGEDSPGTVDTAQAGFARYAYESDEREVRELTLQRIRRGDSRNAALTVSWAPLAGPDGDAPGHVVYRLVSTEGSRGYSPDQGHLVQTTAGTSAVDDRPLASAVRHFQVWANAGASADAARAAQPVLHAAGVVIGTPLDVEIGEDFGRVIGRWSALPGVDAIRVYRVPAELAEHDGPAFRIAADHANLTGFVDDDAERGCRYLYRMRCEVDVDGVVRLSEAVESEIQISAVREPVTDLTLRLPDNPVGPDGTLIDLDWTPPKFGHVLVFRTPDPPSADAQGSELDASVLDQAGLNRNSLLRHPVSERIDDRGARRSVLSGVPWPHGWNRAYFTPVTVLDDRACVGISVSTVRTGLISDIALMEYCNKQVLTFDWPQGAASVMVYIAPKDHDPRQGLTGRCYEVALADYEKYGGMRFAGDLPNVGCSLHLVPVAFTGGRRVLGAPASIQYGGLLRLWYDVWIGRDHSGFPLNAAVTIRAEADATGSPPFVLVNNPERLPLTVHDGDAVDMYPTGARGTPTSLPSKEFQWSALGRDGSQNETWVGDVRGLRGWIRLFANLPAKRLRILALLDPPVESLMLTPTGAITRCPLDTVS